MQEAKADQDEARIASANAALGSAGAPLTCACCVVLLGIF
jgi:hypothetical protein